MDRARVHIAAWVEDYNQPRPHSALGYETPAAFAAELHKQWPAPLHRPLLHRAHAQQSCCPLIPAGGKLGVTSAAFTEGLRRILRSSVNPSCRTAVCSRIRSRGTIPSSGTLPQPA